MKLLAVIVNYRTPSLTLRALEASLRELSSLPDARVTVVDNGSHDGSIELLRRAVLANGWSDRVLLVESPVNGGFAYGVNLAVAPGLRDTGHPEYVYLLNSDARPGPGAIATLVRFMDSHPRVGIAGSLIHGPEGETHDTAFRFPSLASQFEERAGIGLVSRLLERFVVSQPVPKTAARVDWLAGASMIIRSEVFRGIGLFDENYFVYFEETDFCRNAARSGWETWYVPESRAEHLGAATSGWKDFSAPRPSYWFEGRRYYFWKHHGRLGLWGANLLWIAGYAIGAVWVRITGRPRHQPARFLRDFLRHNLTFRPIGRRRPRPQGLAAERASASLDPASRSAGAAAADDG